MKVGICPECDAPVPMPYTPTVGLRMICAACMTPLAITKADPVELDWSFEEPLSEIGSASEPERIPGAFG